MPIINKSLYVSHQDGLNMILALNDLANMLKDNGNKQAAEQIRIDCCALAYALGSAETLEKVNEVISDIEKYKTKLQCKQ